MVITTLKCLLRSDWYISLSHITRIMLKHRRILPDPTAALVPLTLSSLSPPSSKLQTLASLAPHPCALAPARRPRSNRYSLVPISNAATAPLPIQPAQQPTSPPPPAPLRDPSTQPGRRHPRVPTPAPHPLPLHPHGHALPLLRRRPRPRQLRRSPAAAPRLLVVLISPDSLALLPSPCSSPTRPCASTSTR